MTDYSTLFPNLDSVSKTWVYVANQRLSDDITRSLRETLIQFGANWSSHGRTVQSDYEILEDQIVVLSAGVEQGEISGCGIDKSLHILERFAIDHNFAWADALSIVFRSPENSLKLASRPEFRRLIKSGQVGEATIVLDTSLSVLSELREGLFELPAGNSWHGRVFQIETASSI